MLKRKSLVNLKVNLTIIRLMIFNWTCKALGMPNYHTALTKAASEIGRLEQALQKIDRRNALDVRSQLDVVNFDKLGGFVWIRVSDERMLRHDVFNQIRDYLKGRQKDPPILMLTGKDIELQSLSDEDLQKAGLRRLTPRERN
jgi:hypothetical protein